MGGRCADPREHGACPMPKLSVIVCHHQGELWRGCFESLAQSGGVDFELIVVSSAPSESWAGEWFTVISEPGGPAHKRNVGARCAKGELLVFLDDDTEVSPYTLHNFWLGFQAIPTAEMLFARIYNMERRSELDDCGSWLTPTGFLYARASNTKISHDELTRPTRCLASKSAGCAIRREAFFRVGGFDASYFILGEETDLAWRVWLQGGEVWYWPFAVLWHSFNTSIKPVTDYYTLVRVHTYGCRNYLRCLTTNLGLLRLVRTLPLHLLGWLVAATLFACRGQARRSMCILRGIAQYLQTLPATLHKRRAVQASRQGSDRELMPDI